MLAVVFEGRLVSVFLRSRLAGIQVSPNFFLPTDAVLHTPCCVRPPTYNLRTWMRLTTGVFSSYKGGPLPLMCCIQGLGVQDLRCII